MQDDTVKNTHEPETRTAWPTPLDREQLVSIEQRLRKLDRKARSFIREHPASVVLGAVAVGFLVGRLVRS